MVWGLVFFHPWACSSVIPSGTSSVYIKLFPELAAENQTYIQQALRILCKPFWLLTLSGSIICSVSFLPGCYTHLFKVLFNSILGKSRPERLVKLLPETTKKQENISFYIGESRGHATSQWGSVHCSWKTAQLGLILHLKNTQWMLLTGEVNDL